MLGKKNPNQVKFSTGLDFAYSKKKKKQKKAIYLLRLSGT